MVDLETYEYWMRHQTTPFASRLRYWASECDVPFETLLFAGMYDPKGGGLKSQVPLRDCSLRLSKLTGWSDEEFALHLPGELEDASLGLLEQYVSRTRAELAYTAELRRWLERNGGYMHPSLAISSVTPSGSRGLIALERIDEGGAPLVVVPQSLEFSTARAFMSILGAEGRVQSDVSMEQLLASGATSDPAALVSLLLVKECALGQASEFAPILKLLPRTPPCAWYEGNEEETEDTLEHIFQTLMEGVSPKGLRPVMQTRVGATRAARARHERAVKHYEAKRAEARAVVRDMGQEILQMRERYTAMSQDMHRQFGKQMMRVDVEGGRGSVVHELSQENILWALAVVLSQSNCASDDRDVPLFCPVMNLVNHK